MKTPSHLPHNLWPSPILLQLYHRRVLKCLWNRRFHELSSINDCGFLGKKSYNIFSLSHSELFCVPRVYNKPCCSPFVVTIQLFSPLFFLARKATGFVHKTLF